MDDSIKKRLTELSQRSYDNNIYTFTDFLTLSQLSEYFDCESSLSFAHPTLFGGNDLCERKMIRFGSSEEFVYEAPFPIKAVIIKPLMQKFSDDLSHRDFLGALMNLGIRRETLGDIFVRENVACLFCLDSICDYIVENLTRVKHTSVTLSVADTDSPLLSEITAPTLEDKTVCVVSCRVDAVISKVYNLSRNASLELFPVSYVSINGRICTDNSKLIKEGDIVSVRGYGRFFLTKILGINKKGKQNVLVSIYK